MNLPENSLECPLALLLCKSKAFISTILKLGAKFEAQCPKE